MTEDGIEDAFDVLGEVTESVKTGLWVGDCFIYTNSVNRLNYYVGGEIVTVSHLDRSLFYYIFYMQSLKSSFNFERNLDILKPNLIYVNRGIIFLTNPLK